MQKKSQKPKGKQDLAMDLLNTGKTKLKYSFFLLVLLELVLCCVPTRNVLKDILCCLVTTRKRLLRYLTCLIHLLLLQTSRVLETNNQRDPPVLISSPHEVFLKWKFELPISLPSWYLYSQSLYLLLKVGFLTSSWLRSCDLFSDVNVAHYIIYTY